MRRCMIMAAFLMLAAAAGAQSVESFGRLWGRDRAFGGPHVALADDSSVILINPAGLAAAPRSLSLAELNLVASGPLFDIADIVLDSDLDTESVLATAVADLLAKNDYKLYGGLSVDGPLAFAFVGGGLGFGLYNRSYFMINAASAASIKVSAGEDLLLAGGYAFRIDLGKGNALDIGVGAKGFVRGEIPPTFGIIDLSQVLGDLSSIFRESFILTTGVGVDLGIRWSLDDSLAAAIVCHDIYSPAVMTEYESVDAFTKDPAAAKIGVSNGKLPCLLDIGFLWSPRLGSLASVIDRVCFLLDYGDILDLFSPIPRNPVLNVRLGAEAQVLEIVTVRVGIKEALLNAGIGMDLGIFTVNMCALGTELGLDPGNRPAYNLQLSFEFVY